MRLADWMLVVVFALMVGNAYTIEPVIRLVI
jgi:hypothetical protein